MLLAIDIGNTNTSLGLYPRPEDGQPLAAWRISTRRDRTADEHALLVAQILGQSDATLADVSAVAISNVVPPLAPAVRDFCRRHLRCEAAIVGEQLLPKLPNRYQPPSAVGADRLVDAVAVLHHYGGPAIVVDFGTATVFDAISAEGEYLGGCIAPGIAISMDALFSAAAHLPRVELIEPESVIGRKTVESLQSGFFYGFVGQVEEMVRRLKLELGAETKVIATGGLAELIAAGAECIDAIEPYLTLEGLRLLWTEQCSDRST